MWKTTFKKRGKLNIFDNFILPAVVIKVTRILESDHFTIFFDLLSLSCDNLS